MNPEQTERYLEILDRLATSFELSLEKKPDPPTPAEIASAIRDLVVVCRKAYDSPYPEQVGAAVKMMHRLEAL